MSEPAQSPREVLSSSWRLEPASLAEAEGRLRGHGVHVAGATPSLLGRAGEVAAWLSEHRHEVASFVVLDDVDLCPAGFPTALGRALVGGCVVVDGAVGLTDADAERALEILVADPAAARARVDAAVEAFEREAAVDGALERGAAGPAGASRGAAAEEDLMLEGGRAP
ncbi:unnamed protein product, partial [Prorocentrum cordatum]